MKKIKLLIVTPYFYPKIGGMENYAYSIAKGLKKQFDYEIVVVTSNHEEKKYKEEVLEGMKIYRLPRQFKVSNTPISFKWKKQIKEIINNEKPDIINAHSPVPFISDVTARVCGDVPFLLNYHSGSMKKEKGLIKNFIIGFYESIILKKTINNSNKVICCSDFVKNDFLKDYLNKTLTITPGVDIDLFKPSSKQTKGNNILFVGNLNEANSWKGIDYLIESIKKVKEQIKEIRLTFVGSGDREEYYKEKCKNYKINVTFEGSLRGKKLVKKYIDSDILVLPSISEAESFGMVLIEAMACKKPVIGSNIGGIPYVIDDGKNGLLVPPKDSNALTDAIIRTLKNPKLAKQIGENGYKKVKENFTWDIKVNETQAIIEEVSKR